MKFPPKVPLAVFCLFAMAFNTGCFFKTESRREVYASSSSDTATQQPPSPNPAPWMFVVVGDSRGFDNGVNTQILGEMVQDIIGLNPDIVLFNGDIVNGSSNSKTFVSQLMTWRNTVQPLYDAGIKVYPVRGNHEDYDVSAWHKVFSGKYAVPSNGPDDEIGLTFAVEHKNALFLGFDHYVSIHRINQIWMDRQLLKKSVPHLFTYAHEPAFSALHSDCMDDYSLSRDLFWETMLAGGGRVFFAGHDHFYDHIRIDNKDGNTNNDGHQVICGTAGAPLYNEPSYNGDNSTYTVQPQKHIAAFGYVIVNVNGLSVTISWIERIKPDAAKPDAGTVPAIYRIKDVWSYTLN